MYMYIIDSKDLSVTHVESKIKIIIIIIIKSPRISQNLR